MYSILQTMMMLTLGTTLIVLFGSLSAFPNTTNCDVTINIYPKSAVALLDETVAISCDVNNGTGDVLQLQLSKDDGKPLVFMARGSENINYVTNDVRHYMAEGQIQNRSDERYLRLTVMRPRMEDASTYTCSVVYSDKYSLVQRSEASKDLVVDTNIDGKRMEVVLSYLVTKVSNLEMDRRNLRQMVAEMSKKAKYASAFSATITKVINLVRGQTIVFDKVLMSHGVGYDNTTGIYTAPRNGLYVFHLGMLMSKTDGSAWLSIKKNGVSVATTMGKDLGHYQHSFCSSVVNLTTGDQVSVSLNSLGERPYLGSRDDVTLFSGILIQSL